MAQDVILTLIELLKLTLVKEVLWSVLPLAIATILVIFYFQLYKNEKPRWDTYLSNSLVLIFVSISLLRYIYNINGEGAINFIDYQYRSIAVMFLLLVGLILMRFNFEHLLPEKIARYLSSPLTINIIAYAVILFVYTPAKPSIELAVSLLILIAVVSFVLNLLKIPLRKFLAYIKKEKDKEKLRNVKEIKFQISELKRELKFTEEKLRKGKLKDIEKERKQLSKLKKILK